MKLDTLKPIQKIVAYSPHNPSAKHSTRSLGGNAEVPVSLKRGRGLGSTKVLTWQGTAQGTGSVLPESGP